MHDLPIELLGAPILREQAVAVTAFDEALRDFVAAMFRTMYRAQGQGLAAPHGAGDARDVAPRRPHSDLGGSIAPSSTSHARLTSRTRSSSLHRPGPIPM